MINCEYTTIDTDKNRKQQSLHEKFFEVAAHYPTNIAVIWFEEERKEITYADLADYVLKLIQLLKKYGVTKKEYIAISLPKGVWQVVATLAVLSVGCVYVPMDIDWPIERKKKICKKSNIKKIIETSSASFEDIEGTKTICVNHLTTMEKASGFVKCDIKESAYVIFTSGTTGEPKGVEITHESAVNTINDINTRFHIESKDKCFAISELSFDLSVYDYFGMLSVGGTIVIPKQEERKNADKWLEWIETEGITVWNSVPTIYEMLLTVAEAEKRILPLKKVLLSGDWISIELYKKTRDLTKECLFVSLGGATEAAIWSVYYIIDSIKEEWNSIPYGYPLVNQKVLVMDTEGNECLPGIPGELWIGGVGIAKGYINEEELTREKFVLYKNERWYKTGDLVKLSEEGYIVFLGRLDHQIKLNGYRIELKEIENTILQCKEVDNDIALIVNKNGRPHLVVAIKPSLPNVNGSNIQLKKINATVDGVALRREATIKEFLIELLNLLEIRGNDIGKEMKPLYNFWKKKERELKTGELDLDLKNVLFSKIPMYLDILSGRIDTKELLNHSELNPEYLALESTGTKIFIDRISENINKSKKKNRIGILQARTGEVTKYLANNTKNQEYVLFDTSLAMLNMAKNNEIEGNQYKYSVIREGNIESKYIGTCDMVVAVNTLHQFDDKSYGIRLANMLLRNSGKLMLIECAKEDAMAVVTSYVLESTREIWNKKTFLEITEWNKILKNNGFTIENAEASGIDGMEYIKATSNTENTENWKEYMNYIMRQNLPNYMIPEEIYYFVDFPLNENGKIDRSKILSIIQQQQPVLDSNENLTNNEQQLAESWKLILGTSSFSKFDSFFEAGGDSLLSTKLLIELRKVYGVEFSLTDIFENPHLDQMAQMLEKKLAEKSEMVEGEI